MVDADADKRRVEADGRKCGDRDADVSFACADSGDSPSVIRVASCAAIHAAACMYREILRQIERDGYGVHPGRAVVPRSRKLLAVALTGH